MYHYHIGPHLKLVIFPSQLPGKLHPGAVPAQKQGFVITFRQLGPWMKDDMIRNQSNQLELFAKLDSIERRSRALAGGHICT